MIWIVLGIGLWSALHFFPSLAPDARANLIARLGAVGYRIAFALGVVSAIALMVMGWRSMPPVELYTPPPWGRAAAALFVLAGFLLFGFAKADTNVKRFIRHPQLTGLVLWAIGHLLANGEGRSIVLFGMMGFWALLEMALLNQRQGAWVKHAPAPLSNEIKPVALGLLIFGVFLFLHPYLFGVAPFPPR